MGQNMQSIIDEYINSNDCSQFDALVRQELKNYGPKEFESLATIIRNYSGETNNVTCSFKILNTVIDWYDKSTPKNDSILTLLHISLGANMKYKKVKLDTAIYHFKKAQQLSQGIFPKDHFVHCKIQYNLGETYAFQHESDKSIAHLDSALQLIGYETKHPVKRRLYDFYANAFANKGDAFLHDAYIELNKLYIDTFALRFRDRHQLQKSKYLLMLNRADESLSELTPLLAKREKGKLNKTMRKNIPLHAFNLYFKKQDFEKAGSELKFLKEINKHDSLLTTKAIISELIVELNKLDFDKAKSLSDTIIKRCKGSNHVDLNVAYLNRIFIENKIHNYPEALKYVNLSHQLQNQNNIGSEHTRQVYNNIKLSLLTYYNLYLETNKTEYLTQALELCLSEYKNLAQTINQYTEIKNILSILSTRRTLNDLAITICYELDKSNVNDHDYKSIAAQLMENSKGIVLYASALKNRSSFNNENIILSELTKDSIRHNLSILKDRTISYELKLDRSLVICRQLRALRALYSSKKLPQYIESSDIQLSKTFAGTPFICYHKALLDGSIAYFRIYKDKNQMSFDKFQIDSTEIKSVLFTDSNQKINKSLVEKISRKILPPNINEKITIIPDGLLSYVPFEALNYNNEYLIHNSTISYAFSLTHNNALSKFKLFNKNKLLAIAPTYHSENIKSQNFESIEKTRSNKLSSLDYNIEEVEKISDHFEHNAFYAQNATKHNFIKNISGASIIHIAAHATASDIESENLIHFTPNGKNSTLSLTELYELNIPTDLVTLSACETSLGKSLKGEGILSMARGFAFAGSKSIVSSLWNMNDKSTSKLMIEFYENLSSGQSKDEALRQSKLSYIENTSSALQRHPYYWAGFVAVGDMSPLPTQNNLFMWGLAILGMMGLIFVLKKMRTQRN